MYLCLTNNNIFNFLKDFNWYKIVDLDCYEVYP